MKDFEKTNTEEYFDNSYIKGTKEEIQKNFEKHFDKIAFQNYTGNELDEIDLDSAHLENAFTNKKYYLAMKLLPLTEKEVLYYSVIENYSLTTISKKLKISKKEVVTLKQKAITDFKENLKKICEGDN